MEAMPQGINDRRIGQFGMPEAFLANLDAQTAANLISAAADVVLIIDDVGVIQDMAFASDELRSLGSSQWLGKPWAQTVTVESRPKVEDMLAEASTGGSSKWRHVNHPSLDGADLPLLYSVVPVHRKNESIVGASRHVVVFGRDLRAQVALQQRLVSAQLSMERDYWRLRHVETRYRLLFQVASEAVLIFDASTEKLEEANPAAYELFLDAPRKPGWALADSLDQPSSTAVQQLFAGLRANGRSEPIGIQLAQGARELMLSASLFRQENTTHLLVRLALAQKEGQVAVKSNSQQLLQVVDNAPDAIVVTDMEGRVLSVNRVFLEMAELANEELARGESLEKWLGRTGVDLSVLVSNLRQRGTVRLFATRMRGEYGSTIDVEISAVAITTGLHPCLGFTIRDVSRRLTNEPGASKELPRSAGQMTELVGRVPLRDIVRETTDLIEQLCIEAALELTGDNRASAAEMLGLSRQSLYVKLRRFGVGESVVESQ